MRFSTKRILAALTVVGVVAAGNVQRRSYTGIKVVRLDVHTRDDSIFVEELVHGLGLETWTDTFAPNNFVDVVVPADMQPKFNEIMEGSSLTKRTMHEDLEESIRRESSHAHLKRATTTTGPDPQWYSAYHAYGYHLNYLNSLVAAYPDNAEIVISGASTQGREIVGIHIWGKKKGRPAAVLHGTVHAREWISAKVVEYFAFNLLDSGCKNGTNPLTNKYDYYIFPVVNPDGFVYSQTTDRLWRKNRLFDGSGCIGTDINRNWNYKWGNGNGASTDPCSDAYQGVAPGNTAEYQGLESFMRGLVKTTGVKIFIDYHSYSQMLLSPWGYTCTELPKDAKLHERMLKIWGDASKKRYGTPWTVGPACKTIYATTGDSTDYAYGALNITHSYGAELRDTGTYGFVLPPDQIIPSCLEAWDGFSALMKALP